jgi:hypothetical protein
MGIREKTQNRASHLHVAGQRAARRRWSAVTDSAVGQEDQGEEVANKLLVGSRGGEQLGEGGCTGEPGTNWTG